jgi:vacuolar-type H+-ATPase subunit B/Vma2
VFRAAGSVTILTVTTMPGGDVPTRCRTTPATSPRGSST